MSDPGGSRSLKTVVGVAAVGAVAVVAVGLGLRHQSERALAGWTREQSVPSVSVIHAAPSGGSGGSLQLPAKLDALNSAPIFARTSGYVRRWYVERFRTLRKTVFTNPDSYFQRYAALTDEEADATAIDIWKRINERNLVNNIAPTRDRADVILHKGEDHHVTEVRLRRV